MANVVRTNGFRPVKHLDGSPYNGQVNKYAVTAGDNTAIFVGDLVKLAGTADADGVPAVAALAANGVTIGPVVWVEPNPDNLMQNYRVASTLRYVYVADAADLVCETQEDAVGGALSIADIGLNCNVTTGSGSTVTGQSVMQADTSTKDTVNTLPLRIMSFSQAVDNEVGNANAKILVSFNTHQYNAGTGSTGL